jgi:hypothetical protein
MMGPVRIRYDITLDSITQDSTQLQIPPTETQPLGGYGQSRAKEGQTFLRTSEKLDELDVSLAAGDKHLPAHYSSWLFCEARAERRIVGRHRIAPPVPRDRRQRQGRGVRPDDRRMAAALHAAVSLEPTL